MASEPLLVVLRLVAEEMAAGIVVGQVEEVRTGERIMVRDADELLTLLRQRAGAAVERASADAVRPAVGRSSDADQ